MTTQEKILKNRPVPGRLSNSPVMCKSVKSYDVSFICDHSIMCLMLLLPIKRAHFRSPLGHIPCFDLISTAISPYNDIRSCLLLAEVGVRGRFVQVSVD